MTKLLHNKTLIKFLGIALSILLVVALIPQISIAYGSKDDVLADTPLAETGESDEAAGEGEEAASDDEENAASEEGTEDSEEEVEGEIVTIDGVEMVSHKVEVPGEDPADQEDAPAQSDEGIAVAAEETPAKEKVRSERLVASESHEIEAGEKITNISSPLKFSGNC